MTTTSTRVEDAKLDMESEANLFAMYLLMPSDLLRKEMNGKRIAIDDDAAVAKLAAKFKVPNTVMALRLGMMMQDDGRRSARSLSQGAGHEQ